MPGLHNRRSARCQRPVFQPERASVAMFDKPIDPSLKVDISAAGLIPSRMIGYMDVENSVDIIVDHLGRVLSHDGGMIDIIDNADLGTPRRPYDLETFHC
jgi:hypothetical protein